MNKPIHPAVAEHVMEENARLRQALQAMLAECDPMNLNCGEPWCRARAALSQQAEPAPAQTEREIAELIDQRDNAEDWANKLSAAIASHTGAYIGEHSNMNCPWANALEAIENTRPAQTEQQPIRLPERKRTDHLPKEYKTMTVVRAGLEAYNRALDDVAALNAAPIAQTTPQPEQSGLPQELFDGYAVYQETVRHRRDNGLLVRTSPENVSDTLDAVARLIKARRAALSAQGDGE